MIETVGLPITIRQNHPFPGLLLALCWFYDVRMSNAIWHFDEGPVEKAGSFTYSSFKNSSAASQNLGPRAAQSNRLSAARAPRAVAQKHPRPRPIQAAPPRRTYPLRGASGPSVQSGSRSERNPRAHGPPPATGTCRWAVVRRLFYLSHTRFLVVISQKRAVARPSPSFVFSPIDLGPY